MGALCNAMSRDAVLVGLAVEDQAAMVRRLAQTLTAAGVVTDIDRLCADVMDREALSSTAVGAGCAIPHAHSPAMRTTAVAAARLEQPLECGAADGRPVSLVFLMVGPPTDTGLHLRLLSKLARLLHDPRLRDALLAAADAETFMTRLCERDG